MKIKTKKDRRERIALRQRKRIAGTPERPRLRVFRSMTHIYAQVIDDLSGTTLAAAASTEPSLKTVFSKDVRGGNQKGAEAIGAAEDIERKRDPKRLTFVSDDVLKRVEQQGDLFDLVLNLKQKLPALD